MYADSKIPCICHEGTWDLHDITIANIHHPPTVAMHVEVKEKRQTTDTSLILAADGPVDLLAKLFLLLCPALPDCCSLRALYKAAAWIVSTAASVTVG